MLRFIAVAINEWEKEQNTRERRASYCCEACESSTREVKTYRHYHDTETCYSSTTVVINNSVTIHGPIHLHFR